MPLSTRPRCVVLLSSLTAILIGLILAVPAQGNIANCEGRVIVDPRTGELICLVEDDDGNDGDRDGDNDGDRDGDNDGGGGDNDRTCEYEGEEIPCVNERGAVWSYAARAGGCYLQALSPQPGYDHPAYADLAGEPPYPGAIYSCASPLRGGSYDFYFETYLADPPPEVEVVDPEVLARQAIESMQLTAIDIGMAPNTLSHDAGSMGLVGAPVWMWAENPSPRTWGPNTASASAGSVTVTVTAEVQQTVWDMGDGNTVTCTSPGEAYSTAKGVRESPECGHRYQMTSAGHPDGAFAISATTHWVANWEANTGDSGVIELDLTATEQVRIGERQLIEQ